MSKKDYQLIAESLRRSHAPQSVIWDMAQTLALDYSGPYSFDREKFMQASGYYAGGLF